MTTPKEVVQRAFGFEQCDVIPYHIRIDDEVQVKLDGYFGSRAEWQKRLIPYIKGGMCGTRTYAFDNDGTVVKDAFGVIMEKQNILHVLEAPLRAPSLRGYRWPAPEDLDDFKQLRKELMPFTDSLRWAGLGFGLFERSWLLRGMENLLVDLIENPAFVEDLLDGILDVHIRTMDLIIAELPIDVYFSGDDWCDQRGPMMGPELFEKFYKPRLKRLLDHCHDLGYKYIAHSCGNVLSIVDDLAEIGLDGLESLQPEAMDVFELKRKANGKMILVGGIGTQRLLPLGSPGQIKQMVRRLQIELGRGGGYVLGPAKPIMRDVPLENAVALLEAVWEQS